MSAPHDPNVAWNRNCTIAVEGRDTEHSRATQASAACGSPGIGLGSGDIAEPLGLGSKLGVSSTIRAPLKRLRRAAEPDEAPLAAQEVSEATNRAEDRVEKVSEAHGGKACCHEAGCGRSGVSALNVRSRSVNHCAAARHARHVPKCSADCVTMASNTCRLCHLVGMG